MDEEPISPFECVNLNCGHKPTEEEVIDHSADCVKCGDTIRAYTIDAAECIYTWKIKYLALLAEQTKKG